MNRSQRQRVLPIPTMSASEKIEALLAEREELRRRPPGEALVVPGLLTCATVRVDARIAEITAALGWLSSRPTHEEVL